MPINNPPAIGEIFQIKVKSADQTVNNSVVLVDDTHLVFPIAANEVYDIILNLYWVSSIAGDIKFAILAPAGSSGQTWMKQRGATVLGCANLGAAGTHWDAGSATNQLSTIIGKVRNGATPGNVQLQWAQNAADATNTQLLTGSTLLFKKVA